MSLTDIFQISGSAMTAQTVRLNTVASNLANAESPASSESAAYKARSPVFASVYHQSQTGESQREIAGASVAVADVVTTGGAVSRYEPHNPLADQNGNVWYPDINVVEQMADMTSASRNFETDVDVLNNVKSMQQSLLKLGENV
ncbi:flagellar basal body rod protein FlgC [Atlantibacter sp.]|uniref:flagellar basal body rod protein FlgC n=1 Tax=Atlantibacter sp. TaxID=1903473 RepID=UPI00289FF852|nr:flagellar basal body rod protein FlgC [Atlantibacter sp.]